MSDRRANYPWHTPLQTRWADNDAYGHLNNAIYLSLFDTALTAWQVDARFLTETSRFLVVATTCEYHAELAYPDQLICGVACDHIGQSSFRFRVALFKESEERAATTGSFTQVAVEIPSHKTRPLSDKERNLLASIALL
ncbi:acyl-CoA thioesterase [Roseobacteraceae bacterium S113]